MARRPLLALLTALVLGASAGASAAETPFTAPACHRTTATPRVVATRTVTGTGRAAIVACDRASGHLRTLRHGSAGYEPKPFPVLGRPAVRGTTVIWTELVGRPGRFRQDLRSADVRHATRQTRRAIAPALKRDPARIDADAMGVYVLARGALAYLAYSSRRDPSDGRLVLERPGHAGRLLSDSLSDEASVQDGGRTIVWQATAVHSFDVAPLPRDADGCSVRAAFHRAALDTPAVRVAAGDYPGDAFTGETPIRVCWKATGHDVIATTLFNDQGLSGPVVANGPFVALTVEDENRYDSCPTSGVADYEVRVVDARTGRPTAALLENGCIAVRSLVVDAAGVPAWLVTDGGGARVEVPGPRGEDTVLDSGPAGGLADLAAAPSGNGFTWTHDGVRRGWDAMP